MTRERENTSKHRYEHILACVEANTGGRLGATIDERSVRTSCCANGHLEVDEYERALQAAIENDDLARYEGELARATVEDLRAVVQEEVERDDPDRDKIGQFNEWIDQVRETEADADVGVQEGAA